MRSNAGGASGVPHPKHASQSSLATVPIAATARYSYPRNRKRLANLRYKRLMRDYVAENKAQAEKRADQIAASLPKAWAEKLHLGEIRTFKTKSMPSGAAGIYHDINGDIILNNAVSASLAAESPEAQRFGKKVLYHELAHAAQNWGKYDKEHWFREGAAELRAIKLANKRLGGPGYKTYKTERRLVKQYRRGPRTPARMDKVNRKYARILIRRTMGLDN